MTDSNRYAKFNSRHSRRPRHAKATRWARAVARVESVKLWFEVAIMPVGVFA